MSEAATVRKGTLAVLVVGLLAVLLWRALGSRREFPAPSFSTPASSGPPPSGAVLEKPVLPGDDAPVDRVPVEPVVPAPTTPASEVADEGPPGMHVLTVVGEDGEPVPGVVFGVKGHGPLGIDTTRLRRAGAGWLVPAEEPPLHLWIDATGYRGAELDVDADRRVVIERGPHVRWVVVGKLPVLPEGWCLEGKLFRRGPLRLASPSAPFALDSGAAEQFVSVPGTYEASYDLVRTRAGARTGHWDFREEDPAVFEVVDTAAVQVLRVPAPSPALEAEMRATIDAEQ